MDEIKRNKRWTTPTPHAEFNCGEIIVKENVAIKLKELVSNWTKNPGIIAGLQRTGTGFDADTLNIDETTVLKHSTDLTDFEDQTNMLKTKKQAVDRQAKLLAASKKAEEEKQKLKAAVAAEREKGELEGENRPRHNTELKIKAAK